MDDRVYSALVHTYVTFVPGAHFIKTKHKWKGEVYLISKHLFPTGLLPSILATLKEFKEPYSIEDQRTFVPPSFNTTKVSLRDYQRDTINTALAHKIEGMWWPRGVLRLATGAGKTEIAVAMTEIINVPTLFICHRQHLVTQAIDRFAKFNIKTGILCGGKKELRPNIIVATGQTLFSMLKKEDPDLLLLSNRIQQIFFDEAHLLAANYSTGNLFVKVSNCFPNAFYRWGLTATPFMKDEYSNRLLEGTTGKQIVEIRSQELIDSGYLADIEIVTDRYPHQKLVLKPKLAFDLEYTHGIVINSARNSRIEHWMKTLPRPILLLVEQIAHGEYLLSLARKLGLKSEFVNGLTKNDLRTELINQLNSKALDILVASTIFDDGVDIPEIHSVILAGGKKSPVKLLQRIGRGLRKSSTKSKVKIINFYDHMFPSLEKHSKERIKVLEEEFNKGAG